MSQAPCIPIKVDVNGSFGMDFIGVVLSSVFYGVTVLQAIFYYQTYPKDKAIFKLMVAVVLVLDTTCLALDSHGVYTYLVTNWSNPEGVFGKTVWSISSEPAATGLLSLIVRAFFLFRIYAFDRRWRYFVGLLSVICLFLFSLSIVVVQRTDSGSVLVTGVVKELHWMAIVACTFSAFLDVTIALTLCFQLYRARAGMKDTEKMIQLITIYVITSGLVTGSINLAVLVSFLASNTLLFQLFTMLGSKAYANALLATLNSRRSIRGRAEDTFGTFATGNMVFAPGVGSSSQSGTTGTRHYPRNVDSKVDFPLSTPIRKQSSQVDASSSQAEEVHFEIEEA